MGRGSQLLGIDLGTTALKVLVLEPGGTVVAEFAVEMGASHRSPERFEQEPDVWWAALVEALTGLAREGVRLSEIRAAGISAQTHGVVLTGADCVAVRPCLTWADMRGVKESEELEAQFGSRLRARTGNAPNPAFGAPKLAWLANNESSGLEQAAKVLLPKDWLRARLTGEFATDPSDAASTLLYDVHEQAWDPILTRAVGVDLERFPTVVQSADVAGHITRRAADETGLREGMPIVTGGSDVACAALGAGVVSGDSVYINAGTAAVMVTPSVGPEAGSYYVFQHVIPKSFLRMVSVFGAGMSHSWFGQLAGEMSTAGDGLETVFSQLESKAADVPPGSHGLLFLPYLIGRGFPDPNPEARGALVGLTPSHDAATTYRAVLEGISLAIRAAMESFDTTSSTYRFGGGARKSPTWRQSMANVLARPLDVIDYDASPVGAAMLAGLGSGVFASVEEAVGAFVRPSDQIAPDPAAIDIHEAAYRKFTGLIGLLDPHFATEDRPTTEGGGVGA